MSSGAASTLEDALRSHLLRSRLGTCGAEFLERHPAGPLPRDPGLRRGLAAVLATQPAAVGFLARRSALAERLSELEEGWLVRRALELGADCPAARAYGLEHFLDEIRLLRREDTVLAACFDLAEAVPFSEISEFLSCLAESIVRRALCAAEARGTGASCLPLAVLAMGKLAGREFSYHSDLDLIFLTPGGPERVEEASRVAQRLVGYLSTMTGAGVAYPVDSRLRPSGHQGMLVTTFEGFERYQRERAEPWEHLALMRSRAIAGAIVEGQSLLDRTRAGILASAAPPWPAVSRLRARVHAERGREGPSRVAFKTGVGGIMDVEFLACGGLLERGGAGAPSIPSVPAMLRAVAGGAGTEALLQGYAFLRRLEARIRWVTGRAEECIEPASEAFEVAAALMEPEEPPAYLLERLASVRREIAAAADRVLAASSILAL